MNLFLATMLAMTPGQLPEGNGLSSEPSRLDGTWIIVNVEKNGQNMNSSSTPGVTIQGNTITYYEDGKPVTIHLDFEPGNRVRATVTKGYGNGKMVQEGVYVLSNDNLVFSLNSRRGTRDKTLVVRPTEGGYLPAATGGYLPATNALPPPVSGGYVPATNGLLQPPLSGGYHRVGVGAIPRLGDIGGGSVSTNDTGGGFSGSGPATRPDMVRGPMGIGSFGISGHFGTTGYTTYGPFGAMVDVGGGWPPVATPAVALHWGRPQWVSSNYYYNLMRQSYVPTTAWVAPTTSIVGRGTGTVLAPGPIEVPAPTAGALTSAPEAGSYVLILRRQKAR